MVNHRLLPPLAYLYRAAASLIQSSNLRPVFSSGPALLKFRSKTLESWRGRRWGIVRPRGAETAAAFPWIRAICPSNRIPEFDGGLARIVEGETYNWLSPARKTGRSIPPPQTLRLLLWNRRLGLPCEQAFTDRIEHFILSLQSSGHGPGRRGRPPLHPRQSIHAAAACNRVPPVDQSKRHRSGWTMKRLLSNRPVGGPSPCSSSSMRIILSRENRAAGLDPRKDENRRSGPRRR